MTVEGSESGARIRFGRKLSGAGQINRACDGRRGGSVGDRECDLARERLTTLAGIGDGFVHEQVCAGVVVGQAA